MPKQQIYTSNITEYHLDTHEGVEMISRYHLFYQLIAEELTEDKAQLLAEPVKDIHHNRVNWYSNLAGNVVPFDQLAATDKKYATDIIAERRSEFLALSKKFLGSGSRNRKLAGELLANILKTKNSYQIFLVGDRPVVAGWGLTSIARGEATDETQSISHILREKTSSEPLAEPNSIIGSNTLPLAESNSKIESNALLSSQKIRSEEKKVRGFWFWWPLWGLGLLASVLFLLFWLVFGFDWPLDGPPVPAASRELMIPEDAAARNDFSFMEGCWLSKSESLINNDTKLPIMVKYCFDQAGQAKVTLDETDVDGKYTMTCTNTAFVSFKDNGIEITDQEGQQCPDGRSYKKTVMNCQPNRDRSQGVFCTIIQDSKDEIIQTDFFRVE